MTGTEFQKRILKSEYSQRELARRWDVSHTTIQRECGRDEVRGHFRDAILRVTENDGEKGPSPAVARGCVQAKSHLVDALEAANPVQAYTLLNQAIQTLDEAVPEGDT